MNEPDQPPIEVEDLPASPPATTARGHQKELLTEAHLRSPRQRKLRLPIILFLLTCLSTFIAGALNWNPSSYFAPDSAIGLELRRTLLVNWDQGLIYMCTVLGILLCHEMGHFLAAKKHGVPASYPFFIPFPISPIGTMGAVIGMAGNRADRRQLFDIGIAGPLAGLAVAFPVLWFGITQLDMTQPSAGLYELDCPYIVRLMLPYARPDLPNIDRIALTQTNALFIAAWVGMLITGLNMMPISQLDGGHIIYTLFLKKAHLIARVFLFCAISYVVLGNGMWTVMVILVILMGADHPPTANDHQPLGWFRTALGYASLAIPILCFPARGFLWTT